MAKKTAKPKTAAKKAKPTTTVKNAKSRTSVSPDRRIVRLVARLTEDPEDGFPLTFEVVLSGSNIQDGRAYLGFQGTLSGELSPFVLLPDGRLDFGVAYEIDADRYTTINILSKEIELGTLFTTSEVDPDTDKSREYVYAIRQIVPL